jgi:hypothetical protein
LHGEDGPLFGKTSKKLSEEEEEDDLEGLRLPNSMRADEAKQFMLIDGDDKKR